MDYEPENRILHLYADSVEVARKRVNLVKPGEFENVVKILREWIQQQPHFRRKDFSDTYIKMTILTSKGSVERAKKQLDKMCTFRTLLPDWFQNWDFRNRFQHAFEDVHQVILPKLTKDHHRVFLYKCWKDFSDSSHISDCFKFSYVIAEYAKQCDFAYGYHLVMDFLSSTSILDVINKLNILELKQSLTIYMEAYGMKILGIHVLSSSKLIEAFVAILKQILKPKIVSRIHIHKSWEKMYDVLGKDVIPCDFGGHEKPLKEIHEDLIAELSTVGFKKYLHEINSASTNESLRQSAKFNKEYAGMPGTFRVLSVD